MRWTGSKTSKWLMSYVLFICCFFTKVFGVHPTLRDTFKNDFLIGVAVHASQFYEKNIQSSDIIKAQFNSVTSENVLKWESVHPSPKEYAFEGSDRFVKFGEENKMFVVGHTLIWHQQTPAWVFEDDWGNRLDCDTLLERMSNHIHTVVSRYKGRIHGWDVVNEALNNDGTMRQSLWMQILGEDYVIKAFQFAHEADPDAELYYNDYNLESEPKRAAAMALISKLQASGITVKAIGLQSHNTLDWPSIQQLEDAIVAFAKWGIAVNISELDVDVLPIAWEYEAVDVSQEVHACLNPYQKGLPDLVNQALTTRYTDLFKLYLKYHKVIKRVTLWGVSDQDSWLNDIPVKGRTNYPLLFDRKGKTKSAFNAVILLKQDPEGT